MSIDVIETKNYGQFNLLHCNRPIKPRRVEELKKSITQKNMLKLHPIIVAKDYSIIDGQHRLVAAEQLDIPIYYVFNEDAESGDIILCNKTRHNWSLQDYIHYHAQLGKQEYIFVEDLWILAKDETPVFAPLYHSLYVFCGPKRSGFLDTLKNGTMKLNNKEKFRQFVIDTFPKCKKLNQLIKSADSKKSTVLFFTTAYMSALVSAYKKMTKKQYAELWLCLERDYLKLTSTSSTDEARKFLETSFNRNRHKPNHFHFVKRSNEDEE